MVPIALLDTALRRDTVADCAPDLAPPVTYSPLTPTSTRSNWTGRPYGRSRRDKSIRICPRNGVPTNETLRHPVRRSRRRLHDDQLRAGHRAAIRLARGYAVDRRAGLSAWHDGGVLRRRREAERGYSSGH